MPHNVHRREKRTRARITSRQKTVKQLKHLIFKKDERILNLESCLEETKSCFLEERKKSSLLQKKVLSLEQSLDMLTQICIVNSNKMKVR